ncbi:hypothetical protein GE061_018103 [Apolygus lucorum]|uniref:Uncharacterized protein n=1 Tax=Apolygus lucorum TaxID=248454 RepID=A0A8S9XCY3_APOLU|nr:hypothetical protein GE061_018103 [Apolygus lucorum]
MWKHLTNVPTTALRQRTPNHQQEWAYLQRVVQGGGAVYEPLREKIRNRLTPAIQGWAPSAEEHNLLALPVKLGGLAIENPVSSFDSRYNTSKIATSVIAGSISSGTESNAEDHTEQVTREHKEEKVRRKQLDVEKCRQTMEELAPAAQRILKLSWGRSPIHLRQVEEDIGAVDDDVTGRTPHLIRLPVTTSSPLKGAISSLKPLSCNDSLIGRRSHFKEISSIGSCV